MIQIILWPPILISGAVFLGKCPIFQRECKVLLQKDELGVKKPSSALIEQIEGFRTFYFEGHIGHFRWGDGVTQLHKFAELS